MAAPKPDPERDWRKALDAHAAHTMHGVITHAAGHLIANAEPGPLVDGRPSIDVQGPDGKWRRYLVRLTEAPYHAPLDPAHLGGDAAMTLPSVRPDPPEANQHGYIPRYVSPHGHLAGLRERLAKRVDRMGRDRSLPWVGLGLVNDLEVTLQLLNMREFAEWLRTNGDPAHARFADEIIDAQDALRVAGYASPSLGENVEGLDDENRANEAQALALDDMRKVLVEYGALAPDDRATPLPDLLRALLS